MARKGLRRLGWGFVNYLVRFFVGGVLFMGIKMNPEGFTYGFLLTATAAVTAYCLLRFIVKPHSLKEAIKISLAWATLALILDITTAQPIIGIDASYLLSEVQTWTRLLAIIAVAPFVIQKDPAQFTRPVAS